MPPFTVDASRFDPYKSFKFKVRIDGRVVAGADKVSALKRTAEFVGHRTVGDASTPDNSPSETSFEPITIERGVTHDAEFERWASKIWYFSSSEEPSLENFRKEVLVELYNEVGQKVLTYKIHGCWVSEFQALPDLDANANAVAIQTLVLQHEGWDCEYEIPEPSEKSSKTRDS